MMKYFAEVVGDTVINIVQSENDFIEGIYTEGSFIEYCPDGSFRYNPASIGGKYNKEKDGFIPIKIYNSWIFNEETLKWEPPVTKPEGPAIWDEENLRWNTPE